MHVFWTGDIAFDALHRAHICCFIRFIFLNSGTEVIARNTTYLKQKMIDKNLPLKWRHVKA